MHTVTGGGVTYLRGVLPELVKDERFEWWLLVPREVVGRLHVPEGVVVKTVGDLGFWRGHVYEQLKLPFLCRLWGIKAVLCNANYVPLLAPRPLPVIHTTARAAGQARGWRMKIYWAVLKGLTRLSLLRAPLAFAVARHVIADYAGARVARKVRVANPAVDSGLLSAQVVDGDSVVTVGDFYPQKDYPTLVRAFKVLHARRPATRLVIIGRPVDAGVHAEVRRLVKELGLENVVTLTGAMAHDALMKVIGQAAVYVNCSRAECFNLPVLEALACGVPCVLPDVDFQAEVAGPAALYVPVAKGGDVAAAYAVAMFGVLENEVVANTLRKQARARAAEFSWAKTARVLCDGVAQVLGR
ncbi:MAG: glycosyltransferase [Proteobacteria bacterium]|nr:glycosyltransferase [Pseudomonadota bacterium]